jgi:hypothetical protein
MEQKIEIHFYQLITDQERYRIAEQVLPFVQENFEPMPRLERKKGKAFYIEIEPYYLQVNCKINTPIKVVEMKEDEFFETVDRLSGRWN